MHWQLAGVARQLAQCWRTQVIKNGQHMFQLQWALERELGTPSFLLELPSAMIFWEAFASHALSVRVDALHVARHMDTILCVAVDWAGSEALPLVLSLQGNLYVSGYFGTPKWMVYIC